MHQSYKVFINNFFILFIASFKTQNDSILLDGCNKIKLFAIYSELIQYLIDNNYSIMSNVVLITDNPSQKFNCFQSNFQLMNAAGGVVQNKENKILMINKNNIWDLPKGKVNQGEAFKLAAFREIKEETGVQCARIIDPKPYVTYHIYKDKFNFNVLTLKATTWFFIMAEPSQVLEPQLEEDIVDVKWIDCDDFQKIKTYESIKGPVNFFT